MRCGESLTITLLQIYCWVLQWNNIENRSIFDELVMLRNSVANFLCSLFSLLVFCRSWKTAGQWLPSLGRRQSTMKNSGHCCKTSLKQPSMTGRQATFYAPTGIWVNSTTCIGPPPKVAAFARISRVRSRPPIGFCISRMSLLALKCGLCRWTTAYVVFVAQLHTAHADCAQLHRPTKQ